MTSLFGEPEQPEADPAELRANHRRARHRDVLGATDPLTPILRWMADNRSDRAAAERARQFWLERQAAEEATLASVLADLAERHVTVSLHTSSGGRPSGKILALGADFITVAGSRVPMLVAVDAIESIHTPPGERPTVGDRPLLSDRTLAQALGELAADRPDVLIRTGDGTSVTGRLMVAGRDVVILRSQGTRMRDRSQVYVPVASIGEVTVTR